MYAPTFSCQDEKEQFEARIKQMADEELKELKRKQQREQFLHNFWKRVELSRKAQMIAPIVVDDYDYQMDIDSQLSDLRLETLNEEL